MIYDHNQSNIVHFIKFVEIDKLRTHLN